MRKISLLIFLVGFLLFRPYQLDRSGMLYHGDDYSYLAHATAIVYGQFPSYQKEYYMYGEGRPTHSVGAGVVAVPFVYSFSWIDRMLGNRIVQERTLDNLKDSWTVYGFLFSSVFFLWLGCFFLYKGLRLHFDEWASVLTVFLLVLCEGIPLFAYRRPVFSHISIFCIQSALVLWLLTPQERRPFWAKAWAGAVLVGCLGGLIVLIRPNNLFLTFAWPLVLFLVSAEQEDKRSAWGRVLLALGVMVVIQGTFLLLIGVSKGYTGEAVTRLSELRSLFYYFHRLWYVLVGIDWGLIYSAPFLLAGLVGLVWLKFPLRRALLWILVPLSVNIYLILAWGTQGGWYGYRYVIPCAVPILSYPLALLLSRIAGRWGKKLTSIATLILCIVPLLSMLAFEGNSQQLTLALIEQPFGVTGWGNNEYQWKVWETLIQQPGTMVIALLKGGPFYCISCLLSLFGMEKLLPEAVQDVYAASSPMLLLKTFIIYALPFILCFIAEDKFVPEGRSGLGWSGKKGRGKPERLA